MNARTIVVCAFGLLAPLGCGNSKPSSGALPTATATAQVKTAIAFVKPPPTALPSSPGTSSDRGKMVRCPSAIAGAVTEIADVEGGVALTVTSKDDATAKEIRERATFLAGASVNDDATGPYNAGGGAFGRCPVVHRGTIVEAVDVAGGSKITVKPKEPSDLDWIRRESRERLKEISEPGAREGAP